MNILCHFGIKTKLISTKKVTKMKAKIKVLFYLRKSKVNSCGKMPIYVRCTVNFERVDISTGIYTDEDIWSSEFNKPRGNSTQARLINGQLETITLKVFEIERELVALGMDFTLENFKNAYKGIKPKQLTLVPIFQDHNDKIKELIGHEYAYGTYERYKTSLKHTIDFLKWKYNLNDIAIDKVDHAFITEYEFYLRSQRKCANNSAVKYIKNFKKIIRICIANGWIDKDPFANYKAKIKEDIREYLIEDELIQIMQKEFASERLELVRDIFIYKH